MVHFSRQHIFIGTHSPDPGLGVWHAHFDAETGALSDLDLAVETPEPAYFVIHPDGRHLYACNSCRPGGVSAFEIDGNSGKLTFLNQVPSAGRGPSHLSLDRTGRHLLDANYDGGYVEVIALAPDGRLGDRTAHVRHEGASVHPDRQTKPHAHSILVDPSNRFALAADLGADRVFVHRFDQATGCLAPNDPPFVAFAPGSGPRHLAWHPNARLLYVINELTSSIAVMTWDAGRGTLQEVQSISTLPEGFAGKSTGAEIALHPNGRYFYASNRGHDSIAVFAIGAESGRLSLLQHVASGGHLPRNFSFDLSGRWLLAANHGSDTVAIFEVDEMTGLLQRHGDGVSVLNPFRIGFLAAPH